jgi:uncharacterized protein (TIGR03086 family)
VPRNPAGGAAAPRLEHLERAFASTRDVVARIRAEHLPLPTPCDDWDVRLLVNHTIGGSYWYGQAMLDRVSPPIESDDDFAAGDLLAAYDEGIRRALQAFGAPGALDDEVDFVGTAMSGRVVLGLACIDTFTHGWDLAVAIGADRDRDPELAELLLELAGPFLPEQLRGTDRASLFRPRATAAPESRAADALAAYLGRSVPPRP